MEESQNGFRSGRGTRDSIFNMRMLIERVLEKQRVLYLSFIDYSKAFDRVQHEKLIECHQKVGVVEWNLRLITNLYWEQRAQIRIEGTLTEEISVNRGARQGCVVSPVLFNVYAENIFNEIEEMAGIKVGGININNMRYADDANLIAENSRDLESLLHKIREESKVYGLDFNLKKTKVMIIDRDEKTPPMDIRIDQSQVEQVDKYVYLGHIISNNGTCEMEIKRRIEIARSKFIELKGILTSREIPVSVRVQLTRTLIWSVLLYGAEA